MCYACYGVRMARTVAHRELRNNSAEILRRVAAGEEFEVTNRGEVVAILLPAATARRTSVIRHATARGFAALPRVQSETPVQQIVDELRGDR